MVRRPDFIIPGERLPPGFAESLDQPVLQPVEPHPAATVILMRDGADGLEVLLLKRHRSAGFVPGAYVFPGGRTDAADADARLLERARRSAGDVVPHHFRFAAVREAFEETGILLARDETGALVSGVEEEMAALRARLMDDEITLLDVLEACNAYVQLSDLAYCAHWITPLPEPRRYDTRFFAAHVPADRIVHADAREMTDAVWLTPAAALARFAKGTLPMVFPTVKTLEELREFKRCDQALAALRARDVQPVMPSLVRTAEGVGIIIHPEQR